MRGWAMDPDRAHAHGVHSVESRDDLAALDLDEKTIDFWARYVPGIVYPYRLNGRTVWQYAPHKRDEHRYLVPKGAEIPLDCLRDDGQGPILLVEGTKQHHAADAWTPPEYAVYGMLGCWGWTKTDLTPWAGRLVLVMFDADFRSNRDVHDAAGALRDTLKAIDAKTKFVPLPGPGSQGLDDLLAKIGDPAERRRVLANLINDATDVLGRAPARKRKAKASDYFDDAGQLKPWDLSVSIDRSTPVLLTKEHRAAVYRNGVYQSNELVLVGVLADLLRNEYRRTYLGTVEDVLLGMLDRYGKHLPERIDAPLLNVRNGLVDLTTGKLGPHSPDVKSAVQFPITYDPKATCPTYDAWSAEIIGAQLDDLEEVMSVMLDPTWTPSRAAFLWGPSKTGKSTFLRLMAALVGRENVSGVTLLELTEDQFARANLYGKVLNVAPDLSARHVRDLAWFKAMTGEDLIRGNRKYGRDFHFVNQALFAFSANTIPTVGEASDAYINRIKPFKFGHSFAGAEKPELEQAMMTELPGILNRLIRAYRRRKDRGQWLDTDLSILAEFDRASDRVKLWLSEEMQIVTEHKGERVVSGQSLPLDKCSTVKTLARLFAEHAATSRQSGIGATKLGQRLREMDGVTDVRQGGTVRALNIIERDGAPFDDPRKSSAVSAEIGAVSTTSNVNDITLENDAAQKLGESTLKTAETAEVEDDRATATAPTTDLPESFPCPIAKCDRQAELMGYLTDTPYYRCARHGQVEPEEGS
jgi:putative DNA primase/helicase